MSERPRGKARRLPLLGQAIIGAALLTRSDSPQDLQPEPPLDRPVDLARFSVVLDLPKPQLAATGTTAGPVAVAIGPSSDAGPSDPVTSSDAGQQPFVPSASLAVPVVSLPPAKSEPLLATTVSIDPQPVEPGQSEPAVPMVESASVSLVTQADPDALRFTAAPLQVPRPVFEEQFDIEALLGDAMSPLQPSVGIVLTDAFPVPDFAAPTPTASARDIPATAQGQVTEDQPQVVRTEEVAPVVPGANSAPPEPENREATAPVAASRPLHDTRLAVAVPSAAKPRPAQAGDVSVAPPPGPAPPIAVGSVPISGKSTVNAYTASPTPFPPGAEPTFSYDDELILQIETSRREMTDTIIAYGTRGGVYLPFGALTRFLDLAFAVSDDGHFASGWFLSEDRTLSINLREGRMLLAGKEIALSRGEAIAFDGELYLRAEDFAKIFPLRLTTNLRAQLVRVETLETFPFEQRLAREKARERLEGKNGAKRSDLWPREATPWQAFAMPMTDIELRAASDSSLGTRVEGDLRLAGDLAFMTARAYLSGSSRDGLTGARIELGRRDPDAGLFGPLRATEFQVGDVSTQALPLGLRGISGRGAAITNAPIDRASLFDAIDLRGELPEGYEVELYRNDILIESTRTPVNGQYEFLQVPVDFGTNVFRLVFFGPQGQRHEEVRRISVGDGRRKPGELVYSFGVAQKDVNLLNVRDPFDAKPEDLGAWRATGSLEYGLTAGLTAQMAGSWFQTGRGSSWQGSAGLRTGLAGTAIRADFGLQKGGGKSAQLGIGGQLFGASYTLTHAEYSGNFSDEVRAFSNDFLDRATEFNVNATVRLGGEDAPIYLPLSARARRLEFADGREQTDASLKGSVRFSGVMLSKTLDYAHTSSPFGFSATSLVGGFDLATLSGSRTQYRASLSYAAKPKLELRSAAVQVDHAFDDRTLAKLIVGHTFANDETRVGLSAIRNFEHFTLSFSGDYAVPSGTYSAALRLGFGFGRNPLTGRFFLDRPGLALGGAVAVRAYHDKNADNRFDEGDLVLPNVEFGLGGKMVATDKQGVAMIGRLGDGVRTNYRVDMETLPDIALYPTSPGVSFVPRAGRVHVSEFPVIAHSEIEGTARFISDRTGKAVSGVRLELVAADGNVVKRVRTEGDGFYLFEQVAPGSYSIRIEPEQANRLGIALTGDGMVTASPEGDIVRRDLDIARE